MADASSGIRRTLALLLMLVLAACSGGDDFEAPMSKTEQLRQEYGLNAGNTAGPPSGSRIIFFGDSITVGGLSDEGYVTLVREALSTLYPNREIDVIGSGVVGDKVSDLTQRLRSDVLSKKPTHVVIYVGVNDVASLGPSKAALDAGAAAYRRGLAGLVDSISAAGAEVMLCTPGVIGEDVQQGTLTNYGLELYAAAVRSVAAEKQVSVCDLRSDFSEYLASRNPNSRQSGILTVDGLHLNSSGNRLVARTMLRALTGTEDPIPTPFVVPTVSPRPKPVRSTSPAPPPRRVPGPETGTSSTAVQPEETVEPAASPSTAPEESPTPPAVQTPDGFPFESPSPAPTE
jgi:lysophospholipase L1-like esterase